MKKKLIAVAFFSTLLTACASPKYKISDQRVRNWIGLANDIEQCINPNLTNEASYSLLSKEERSLFVDYGYDLLSQMIGWQQYQTMKSDPKSWAYFQEKHTEFNNNTKANLLTPTQCEAYKAKFANDLVTLKQKNLAIAQQKQAERKRNAEIQQKSEAFRSAVHAEILKSVVRQVTGNMTPSETALAVARQQQMQQTSQAQQQLYMQQQQLDMQQQQNQAMLEMQERQHQERMRMMQNNQNRSYDVSCNNYGGYTTRCQVR